MKQNSIDKTRFTQAFNACYKLEHGVLYADQDVQTVNQVVSALSESTGANPMVIKAHLDDLLRLDRHKNNAQKKRQKGKKAVSEKKQNRSGKGFNDA